MMAEFYEAMQDEGRELGGFARRPGARRIQQVASAAALWADLLSGRAPSYFLQEALSPRTTAVGRAIEANYPGLFRESLTRSDFPLLTGDVIDRMMLARYREFPSPWRRFMKVTNNLRDFRTVRRIAVDGAEGTWNAQDEDEELEYATMSETGYTYAPKKYSKGVKISFEALMNDDLDAFTTAPDRLGRGGARTISKFATQLYVGASGPHATLYSVGNANIVTSNPVLSVAALNTAFSILGTKTDSDGEPIYIEEAILVVPPQLRVTANNIMNQVTVDMTNTGGASGQTVRVNNWIVGNLELVIDPYIPVVASSANGATSWFLFADPNNGRPAVEVGFINGFNEPQLYQKMADTMRVGGAVDQMAGDFSTMSQEYKGVTAFGGSRLDPKATVGSNGSGS
jgi:hypothetical protein